MEVQAKKFHELVEESHAGKEGIVFLGCGGDVQEWVTGVTEILNHHQAVSTLVPEEAFSSVYVLVSTGGRTDLAFMFHEDFAKVEMGKLSLVRLQLYSQFSNSWVSDFIVNYADHY